MKIMTAKEHLALHDKQIAAMRAVLREGIPLMAEIRRPTFETRRDLRATAAMQKRNEDAINRMIDSRRTTNGHTKGKP
jgi:hypothetical protein